MTDPEQKGSPLSPPLPSTSDDLTASEEGRSPTEEGTSTEIKKRSNKKAPRTGRRKSSGRGASALEIAPSGKQGQRGADSGGGRNDQPANDPSVAANAAPQEPASSSSSSASPPPSPATKTEGSADAAAPSSGCPTSPRFQSLSSPEVSDTISDAERRLAELTVLRGRKAPLDPNDIPLSPMLQREAAPKGRRVSIHPLPLIGVISPLSGTGSPGSLQSAPGNQQTSAESALPFEEAPGKGADSNRRPSVSSRRRASTESGKHAVICAPALKVRKSSESEQELPNMELRDGREPAAATQQPCSANAKTLAANQRTVKSPLAQALAAWLHEKMSRRRRGSQEGRRSRRGSSDRIRRHSFSRSRWGSRGSTQTRR